MRNLCKTDEPGAVIAASQPPPRYGGARRDRTDDLMLAKHALSQLSYGPERVSSTGMKRDQQEMVGLGRLELPTSRLSSARSNQLSYKPKPSSVTPLTRTKSREQ